MYINLCITRLVIVFLRSQGHPSYISPVESALDFALVVFFSRFKFFFALIYMYMYYSLYQRGTCN